MPYMVSFFSERLGIHSKCPNDQHIPKFTTVFAMRCYNGLTLIPPWVSNDDPINEWDMITYFILPKIQLLSH